MAKLMAPNIRIDWYPDGHFDDPSSPTVGELNSGYNLSRAIVTGYTLDFTDPITEEYSGVLSDFAVQVYSRDGYEANLQFFLTTRESAEDNERAFRYAEELFYNPNQSVGYLVKRFGYPCHVDHGAIEEQQIDIFKVQADLPKVLSEDGEPILLDIRFIPQGFAASAVITPWLPPPNTYMWEGTPGDSISLYYNENSEITKRNVLVNPSLEYANLRFLSIPNNYFTAVRGTQGIFGYRSLELTVSRADSYPQQIHIEVDTNVMQGLWAGFSYVVKSSVEGMIETQLYGGEGVSLSTDKVLDTEYRRVRSGAVFIPQGENSLGFTTSIYSSYEGRKFDMPLGEKIHFDGLQIVVGDSEESVLLQLDTYFDGDGEYTQLPPEAVNYVPPKVKYFWFSEPGESVSAYFDSSGRITKRNYMLDPSFEYGNLAGLSMHNYTEYDLSEHPDALYGSKVLRYVPDPSTANPPQIAFRPQDNDFFRSKWLGFSLNIRLSEPGTARAHLFIGYSTSRVTSNTYITDSWTTIKVPPTLMTSLAFNIRAVLFLYDDSGTNTHLDSSHEVLIDGLQMVRGDSAEDVDYQLESYFDGDTV